MVDQFSFIEQGEAKFIFNEMDEYPVHEGYAVVVLIDRNCSSTP